MAQKVFIDGHLYFDRDKDLAMREENAKERKALLEKARKAAEAEKKTGEKPGAEKKPDGEKKPEAAPPPGKDVQSKAPPKPPQPEVAAAGHLD